MSSKQSNSWPGIKSRMLVIPFFMLVAFFSSMAANAQTYDVYNNSAACDFKLEFTITNGMFTNTVGGGIVGAGTTLMYTPPTGYSVTHVTVFDSGGGSNHGTVESAAPVEDAGHCNAGVVDVVWQSSTYTQIN